MNEETKFEKPKGIKDWMQSGPNGSLSTDLSGEALKQLLKFPAERYNVGSLIAEGGMGSVLRATDGHVQREVAMKVTREKDPNTRERLLRFLREGRITGGLQHPGIVPLYDLGLRPDGTLYYTMKLVGGQTLQQILDRIADPNMDAREFPLTRLLQIFQRICDAIRYAHAQGVIHRDLKPDNVMVGEFGEVLVMDWGLAKVTRGEDAQIDSEPLPGAESAELTLAGHVMGSPRYMAPEQTEGTSRLIDDRTDIYQLGGLLYAILTLRPPVTTGKGLGVLNEVRSGNICPPTRFNHTRSGTSDLSALPTEAPPCSPLDPVPLRHCPGGRVPASLSAIAMKALARDPEDRYQTVEHLQSDLQAFLNGFAPEAEQATFHRQFVLFLARHRKKWLVLGVCLLVAVLTIWTVQEMRSREEAAASARHLERGRTLAIQGEYSIAIEELLRAHRIRNIPATEQKLVDTYVQYADALMEKEEWGTALIQLERARALRPEDPDVRERMPRALGNGFVSISTSKDARLWERSKEGVLNELGPLPLRDMEVPEGLRHYMIRTTKHDIYMPIRVERGERHNLHLDIPDIPDGYIYIPGGPFLFGDDSTVAFDGRVGTRQVNLPGFLIRRTPVSRDEYLTFQNSEEFPSLLGRILREQGLKAEDLDRSARTIEDLRVHDSVNQPGRSIALARGISYWEAMAFAEWTGGRLPTELEWEKAVRGVDGRLFPSGGNQPNIRNLDILFGNRAQYPEEDVLTPYGCHGMTQTVWQWTQDRFWKGESRRVVRGGTVSENPAAMRVTRRKAMDPNLRYLNVGFTVCLDIPDMTAGVK